MNEQADYERTTCSRHYSEEDWIDLLLERKPSADREAMLGHLAHCARCRATRETWAPLLAGSVRAQEQAPVAQETQAAHLPSAALHNRLRLRVRLRAAGIRARRVMHAQRRTGIVAAAAAVLLLLCLAGLYRSPQNQAEARKASAAALEPAAASFLLDPQTAAYKVHPELDELGEGYIWFNDMSGEVYVMLEGLLPSDDHDVQVWAVDEQEREHVNLGLLHHDQASRAHLYVKRSLLLQAHHIALTVEPAGGSSGPTQPEVLSFRLQHG